MSGSTPADVADLTTDPNVALALMGDSNRVVRDDFAGPGGWSTGIRDLLEDAGLTEVALEWDASACLTRVANGHANTIRADVAAYPVTPFLGRTVGYIGSPPCQTFSMAGGGAGRAHLGALCEEVRAVLLGRRTYEEAMVRLEADGALDRPLNRGEEVDRDALPEAERDAYVATLNLVDPRNGLILVPARVIRALLDHDGKGPTDLEWVALEQVPPAGPVFDAYAMALRELGFSVAAPVINSADYGVPQTRERKFVIASRARTVTVPEPTHAKGGEAESLFGPGRLPWVSMAGALGWGMTQRAYPTVTGGAGNEARWFVGGASSRATIEDAAATAGEVRASVAERLAADGVEVAPSDAPIWQPRDVELVGNVDFANTARRTLDQPAMTITGGKDYGSRQFVGTPEALDAILEARLAGSDKFDGQWSGDRPATVVASREIVQHPGATKNRFNDSEKTRNDGLRITEAEGGILQGFPVDYLWEGGSKGKRWEQIGNVVCPPVARRVVAALLGVDAAPLPWHAYAWDEAPAPLG